MDSTKEKVGAGSRIAVPTARPDIGPAERLAVQRVMESGWISQGRYVTLAEGTLRLMTGRQHAICVSSGTAAIQLALMAIGLQPGSPVVVPTLAFSAVHNIPVNLGGRLIFLGANYNTWQIEPEDLRILLGTLNQKATVIMAPCYGGMPDMVYVESICSKYGADLIEDAAESFGGAWGGRPAGKFGKISTLSFYANKIFTCGEGGACLTDDEELYLSMRRLANHGIVGTNYKPKVHGSNFRMTDIQAAILYHQLQRRDEMLYRRRQLFARYMEAIYGKILLPLENVAETRSPWAFAGVRSGLTVGKMQNLGIGCRPFFFPGHANELFSGSQYPSEIMWSPGTTQGLRDARSISINGVVFPTSSAFTSEEIEAVVSAMKEIPSGNA